MNDEEIKIEINRIQTFLGDGFEVTKCNCAIRVDKKIELVKLKGWDYGVKPNEIMFYFVFNDSTFKYVKVEELGEKIKCFIKKEYLNK